MARPTGQPTSEQRGDSEVACEVAAESVNALYITHKVTHAIDGEIGVVGGDIDRRFSRAQKKIACT